jgi:transketolase
MKNPDKKYIKEMARQLRIDVVTMLHAAKSGHPGGALSSADIISTLYFGNILKVDPNNPYDRYRDLFVLSAGHYCPVWYSALARKNFFPVEELITLRKFGSRLLGHPKIKVLPGIENSGGSFGQGFSIACGYAYASKKFGKQNQEIYCLLGDGEQNEGQVWEAAMFSAHHQLSNLCAIIDVNKIQIDGFTSDIMNSEPLDEKYKAFGWNAVRIDGNDIDEILNAFASFKDENHKPTVIIADTLAGKGVSFLEGTVKSHGKWITDDEYKIAIKDLEK